MRIPEAKTSGWKKSAQTKITGILIVFLGKVMVVEL